MQANYSLLILIRNVVIYFFVCLLASPDQTYSVECLQFGEMGTYIASLSITLKMANNYD